MPFQVSIGFHAGADTAVANDLRGRFNRLRDSALGAPLPSVSVMGTLAEIEQCVAEEGVAARLGGSSGGGGGG